MVAGGGRQPRAGRPAILALIVALVAAVGAATAPSGAFARTAAQAGRRVTVGLFGDSVTEGIVIPDFQHEGLAAQLTTAETSYGFSPGGQGFIAANQYQWRFNAYGIFGFQKIPADGWAIVGAQDDDAVEPGTDGVSGYSARTLSPAATATTTVTDPDIELLYATSLSPCSFEVTSGSHSWSINTYAPGIEVGAGETPIVVGPGTHRITVHGPSCGALIFDGAVAQKPVQAGTTQIQFDNDGHSARLPQTDLLSRVEEAILEQRYEVSVFLYGYIGELLVSPGASATAYAQALLTRARLARMNGGACLIVHPTPLAGVPQRQVTLIEQVERGVARQADCTYTTVLAKLWNPQAAINRGLVVIDGIHPTAAGYKLIAKALAPVIAQLAR
jgi:hypothetical protein